MINQLEEARLARTPKTWPKKKLKHVAQLRGGGTPSKEEESFWADGSIPWVSPKDMKRRVILDTEDHITEQAVLASATSYVKAGSPLLVVRSGILRHTLPVAIAGSRVTLNQDMKAFDLTCELNAGFFVYWIEGQSADLLLEWRQFSATVESIDVPRMMNGRIALPDFPTQKAIAAFLDRETARIDQLIEKKQRLVELLEEKRQSAITNSFDSALGNLQGTTKLGNYLTKVGSGKTPRGGAEVYTDSGVMFIRSQNVHDDGMRLEDVAFIPTEVDEEMAGTRIQSGDVLLNITGASIGRCAVAPAKILPANVNQHVCILRSSQSVLPEYLQYFIQSGRTQEKIRLEAFSGNREGLNFQEIRSLPFPKVPEIQFQGVVVRELRNVTEELGMIKVKTSNSIKHLQDLRSALITAAVTGQLDIDAWGKRGETDRRVEMALTPDPSPMRGRGEKGAGSPSPVSGEGLGVRAKTRQDQSP